MARPLRILWAGGSYHVMSRGDVLRGAARGSTPGRVGAAGGRGLGYQAAIQAAKVFVGMAKDDFRLKPDAQVFKDLPGFQPISFDKIGLYVDEYRRKLPTAKRAAAAAASSKELRSVHGS